MKRRRRSIYRSPAHFKRNGVSGFHVRGHKVEIALGDTAPWVGQISIDPPHLAHVPAERHGGEEPFSASAMAKAMETLADMIDPEWRGANASIVVDRGPPIVIAWRNGAKLHPQFPLTPQNIVGTLRGICEQMSMGTVRRAGARSAAPAKAPRKARASRPIARKPAGRRKASPAARKPAPRKASPAKRRAPALSRAAKRNGGADLGGYGEDIEKGARVRLSPHTDLYMRGAKYGTAKGAPDRKGVVSVKLDTGRTVRLPASAVQRDYR